VKLVDAIVVSGERVMGCPWARTWSLKSWRG